jgi:hypothetical protein
VDKDTLICWKCNYREQSRYINNGLCDGCSKNVSASEIISDENRNYAQKEYIRGDGVIRP